MVVLLCAAVRWAVLRRPIAASSERRAHPIKVKLEEGIVQQQAARLDRLAHAHRLRALLEHRPLVLEREELRERRLLPPLGKAAAAGDHALEEEAALRGRRRDTAQQHVELRGAEVHR